MSIVFAGTPRNAAVTLRELLNAGAPITLVLTRPDAPVGRKGVLTPSDVAVVADEFGIPVLKTNNLREPELELLSYGAYDFAIVVAFGVILRSNALSALPKGWFNLHYSLLPRWRGAAPVQHALIAGDSDTGVSLFQIDEGLDTGSLIAQVPTTIQPNENAGQLLERLTHLGISLLLQEIPIISSGLAKLEPQSESGVTLAPKLDRRDGYLDVHTEAEYAYARFRGVTPEPGCWTEFKDQTIKLLDVQPAKDTVSAGLVTLIDGRIVLGLAKGSIELLSVQPAGKTTMSAADWFRGQQASEVRFGKHD